MLFADTETGLIRTGHPYPELICLSIAEPKDDGTYHSMLRSTEDEDFDELVEELLKGVSCWHNAKYDLKVLCNYKPSWYPLVFQALEEGRVYCTRVREHILNLSSYGRLKHHEDHNGRKFDFGYSLSHLVSSYVGKDMGDVKKGEDIWRMNYSRLKGLPSGSFPQDAIDYAIEDAIYCGVVYDGQEVKARDKASCSLVSQEFQVASDFALACITDNPFPIDEDLKFRITRYLTWLNRPETLEILYDYGLMVPPQPERVSKNQWKKAAKILRIEQEKVGDLILTDELKEILQDHGIKIVEAKSAKGKQKPLHELVAKTCRDNGLPIKKTKTGRVSADREVLQTIHGLHPALERLYQKKVYEKLVTTELPRISDCIVHFPFDVLKETGRTSSSADQLYSSANGQNVDPRIRPCYKAPKGQLILASDFGGLELVTSAQTYYDLFGYSKLRDILNDGKDAHAYLGAAIAIKTDDNFRAEVIDQGIKDEDSLYDFFMSFKELQPDFFKHFRKFAKPTGLGYPGGLGPATFVSFAKTPYGVTVSVELAAELREIWRELFPEVVQYHDWINQEAVDPRYPEAYCYTAPSGLFRANASFCAAANGKALQSPGAEVAKTALFQLVRETLDPTLNSILYGCKVVNFIHDEFLLFVPDDEYRQARVNRVEAIMLDAMAQVCPDVKGKVESVLTRRWDKWADPVYDDEGNLQVYDVDNNNKFLLELVEWEKDHPITDEEREAA